MKILVTGGAGYLGSVLVLTLIEEGHEVRVLDNLMHGGRALLSVFGHSRFELMTGDVRDSSAVERAVEHVDAVVHLAAIVGDPACARDPEAARAINEGGSQRLIQAARTAGVRRFVFASTCSNYGRMNDTTVLASEDHELKPLSLYAETKVAVERALLDGAVSSLAPTVLRFATLYGLSPRMRFDLTVNQFVMEMLVQRKLTVFGERFWRPYVHVRDAASAIAMVLAAPEQVVGRQVFNVGDTDENYRKMDLIDLIGRRVTGAEVDYISVADDPRDYKVSFERIHATLGYRPRRRVVDGIDEVAWAIEAGLLGNVNDPIYSNLGERPKIVAGAAPGPEPLCVP
jgi:nucleoside-diphosphate-sugar epimerase